MSAEQPNDSLTSLLTELPRVRDRGFTERISYRVRLRELRRRVIFFTAWCCSLVGVLLSLPYERLVSPLPKLLQEQSDAWSDLANAKQLTQSLEGYLEMSNSNIVVALSVGAVLLLLVTFALIRE